MADIKIEKINETYLKVTCEPSIKSELSDHFTFDAPGAKFHPLVRAKKWDGKIRLFQTLSGLIYVGLKNYIEHYAETNNYTLDDNNYITTADAATFDLIEKFCNALNLASNKTPIKIRDYQVEAVYRAITEGRQVLISPTGSGKSLIIYCLMRWNEQFNRKQIVVVPTTSLVEQMYSDFADYSSLNGWSVQDNCSRLYAGFEKSNKANVIISTWQSIYDLPANFFKDFNVIYGDEAHTFKSKSLIAIMNKMVNTPYRVGTTGTLDGTKLNKLVLEGLFGPVFKVTSTKELMDNEQLAQLKIFAIILDYADEIKKQATKLKYQEEVDFIVQYGPRNNFISNLALDQKGNTLVLFQFVEKHGKILHDLIMQKNTKRKVFLIYGNTETKEREAIRAIVEKENDAIIVASYGTFSTGINIKNLHNIILASPFKSRIRNLQSIGRGLRKNDEKLECNLYDIGDDLSWRNKKNYTLQHMIERMKIYNEEHFSYTLHKVKI